MRSPKRLLVAVVALAVVLTGCLPAMKSPGKTDQIALVSSQTVDGWKYDYYRNRAYPCSVSGYQTFTIATKVGSPATAGRPLWIFMHGGGTGYFQPSGQPTNAGAFMSDETASAQRAQLRDVGLTKSIATQSPAFRMVTVSMCNRDLYGGPDGPDPNNPNTTPDGKPRTVNGLFATKAAISFTRAAYPTTKQFIYGTSAGAGGSFGVTWALEQEGIKTAGVIADSGILNTAFTRAQAEQDLCALSDEAAEIFPKRLHPDLIADGNNPDQLVTDGRLTAPVAMIWSINDPGPCGDTPMVCPLRDGSTPTMGSIDCDRAPMRLAIEAQGAATKSLVLRLCVDDGAAPEPCDRHTPTVSATARNTLAGAPADYNAALVTWVLQRLTD